MNAQRPQITMRGAWRRCSAGLFFASLLGLPVLLVMWFITNGDRTGLRLRVVAVYPGVQYACLAGFVLASGCALLARFAPDRPARGARFVQSIGVILLVIVVPGAIFIALASGALALVLGADILMNISEVARTKATPAALALALICAVAIWTLHHARAHANEAIHELDEPGREE